MLVRVVIVMGLAAILAGSSWWLVQGTEYAMAESETVEQPPYDVVATIDGVEIRRYGPRLAAETDMDGGAGIEAGQNAAFLRLAAFIFAQNRQGPEVAMTAPVAFQAAAEPIAMTAPVTMEPGQKERTMRFFMPAKYTLETLPKPGDDRVRIVTIPAQTLAVLRFSGALTDATVAEHTPQLLRTIAGSEWTVIGSPGVFGYDAPGTPLDKRRNEVFVEVSAPASATPEKAG
ncbi:MAG: heme-binding protein [Chloroflexia bacterium]|nr:heme-binding protein [Chloroflexia bacterium]